MNSTLFYSFHQLWMTILIILVLEIVNFISLNRYFDTFNIISFISSVSDNNFTHFGSRNCQFLQLSIEKVDKSQEISASFESIWQFAIDSTHLASLPLKYFDHFGDFGQLCDQFDKDLNRLDHFSHEFCSFGFFPAETWQPIDGIFINLARNCPNSKYLTSFNQSVAVFFFATC